MSERTHDGRGRGPDPRRSLGTWAEGLCASELERRGWRILDRNWRIRMGELDIVALDGRALVMVEVKSQRAGNRSGPVRPVLAVGRLKQRRLRMLAQAWLQAGGRRARFETVRFDVVGITIDAAGAVARWQHVENAF